jgi:hypothetical protein
MIVYPDQNRSIHYFAVCMHDTALGQNLYHYCKPADMKKVVTSFIKRGTAVIDNNECCTRVRTNIWGRDGSKTFGKFEKCTRRPHVAAPTNNTRIFYDITHLGMSLSS